MTQPSRSTRSLGSKEVSINGVSYFVEEDLADEIAGLAPQEQLRRIRSFTQGSFTQVWCACFSACVMFDACFSVFRKLMSLTLTLFRDYPATS